ncbi:MazG-like family protein [Caenibacillus caldisaponilyticus]|uniref:MazG-like family protein n=1 Tax=Caenibacillus caldisaponilyticus TaxID=1674942 RepID=UPI00098871A3|nr:MazG-like family protein [Caenibacillus caldisaponilyticus]
MDYEIFRQKVMNDILAERDRQDKKWGIQSHEYPIWLMILTEEVGEVAQAMQKEWGWGKKSDASNLYQELIHVAAVAVSIAEQVLVEGD